jgi:hypothetical protein
VIEADLDGIVAKRRPTPTEARALAQDTQSNRGYSQRRERA